MGIYQPFVRACDAANEPKILEFYKSDLTIRFFLQINLFIQYLNYLTAFLATLCRCYVICGILQPFLGVFAVINEPKKQ